MPRVHTSNIGNTNTLLRNIYAGILKWGETRPFPELVRMVVTGVGAQRPGKARHYMMNSTQLTLGICYVM
eukprot:5148604-Amphidinium_carterae.1